MLNKIVTQIKREFWEHKTGLFRAPLVLTLLLTIVFSLLLVNHNAITFSGSSNLTFGNEQYSTRQSAPDDEVTIGAPQITNGQSFDIKMPGLLTTMLNFFQIISTGLLCLLFLFVLLSYTHSSLFDDRKNREILFWRSMPVSETLNVLVKVFIICLVIPAIITLLNLLASVVVLIVGLLVVQDFSQLVPMAKGLLFGFSLFTTAVILALGLLPVIGWILCASALAKKSPFMISSSVPVVLWILDATLQKFQVVNLHIKDTFAAYKTMLSSVYHSSGAALNGELIVGYITAIAVGALLIAVTIWLRNHRYEI